MERLRYSEFMLNSAAFNIYAVEPYLLIVVWMLNAIVNNLFEYSALFMRLCHLMVLLHHRTKPLQCRHIVDCVTHHHQPFNAIRCLKNKLQPGNFLVRSKQANKNEYVFFIHFIDHQQRIPLSRINVN